jgi:Holliday junction resolvasome RuvABC endonuclease subunit
MHVIGLDLSMTGTGIAGCDGTLRTVSNKITGDARLPMIRDEIAKAANCQNITLVVIEDLPTHAKSAGITGMVHGAIRTYLLDQRIPYVLITPASLKKYATGKGNAGKPEMAVAAYKRLGIEGVDDNQVDAAWLRAAGLDQLGEPLVAMPAAQRAALTPINWPNAEEITNV